MGPNDQRNKLRIVCLVVVEKLLIRFFTGFRTPIS
jgi:hypothetical protein